MYPDYLIHFNRNHGKKNGQFVSGDGDGDGVTNDRYNYKDNRSGQSKGSVIVKAGSGGGSSSKSLVGRVDASKATRGTGSESNHSGRVMGTGGVQWQKRDARTSGGKSSHKEWHDDAKVQKINQTSTRWAATMRTSDKVKNGSYTRGTGAESSKSGQEIDARKEDRMNQKDNLWAGTNRVKNAVQNGNVTRGTGTESQKSGQDVDMAKEQRMNQKETIWAGMKSVDRISSSKASMIDNNSTSKGVNFVSSEILKLKV